jgi:hypothetical protein
MPATKYEAFMTLHSRREFKNNTNVEINNNKSSFNMSKADLVARAKNKQSLTPLKDFLFNMIVGTIGTSVHDHGDYPRIINTGDVAQAGRLLSEIKPNDLREVYNLERLKADYLEIEEYGLWDLLGPNIFDDHLIPMFERIRAFFHLAAERKQQVVVSWF